MQTIEVGGGFCELCTCEWSSFKFLSLQHCRFLHHSALSSKKLKSLTLEPNMIYQQLISCRIIQLRFCYHQLSVILEQMCICFRSEHYILWNYSQHMVDLFMLFLSVAKITETGVGFLIENSAWCRFLSNIILMKTTHCY